MGKPKSSRTTLRMEMTFKDVVDLLADGNIGAMAMLYNFPYRDTIDAFTIWCGIDDLNIRGEQVWVAYQHWRAADDDTDTVRNERFRDTVIKRDPETLADLVSFINDRVPFERGEQAMTRRASFERKGR